MEAKELRIGNYVLCRGALARVTSISEDGIGYVKQSGIGEEKIPFSLVKPIPLTEEWLVKFGFDKDGVDWYWLSIKDKTTFYGYAFNIITKVCEFNEIEIAGINHVHQLQNLYFALNNEELTIKND